MANEKILIADDDKNICELLRLYLAKEGYTTCIANDGEAAFAALKKKTEPGPAGHHDAENGRLGGCAARSAPWTTPRSSC